MLRFIVLATICAVVVWGHLAPAAGPSEPECRGHSLSYWVEQYTGLRGTEAERADMQSAIREMGTNALPCLVDWLRNGPPRGTHSKFAAAYVMQLLGPSAAPAIPDLAGLANDASHKGLASTALWALQSIGPAALPAVTARLGNPDFPTTPYLALGTYFWTRTSPGELKTMDVEQAKAILEDLSTNSNSVLENAARQALQLFAEPPSQWLGHPKTLHDVLNEMMEGNPRPEQIPKVVYAGPRYEPGEEPYPYPLRPGTDGWKKVTVPELFKSMEIPKEWRDHATSWQMFQSGVTHPYFKTIGGRGESIARSYEASKKLTMPILSEMEAAPDFGKNVLRYLSSLDLVRMESALMAEAAPLSSQLRSRGTNTEPTVKIDNGAPDFMDYNVVCYMACLDSALNTMDKSLRQTLFWLAVRHAAYLISVNHTMAAAGPVRLMFTIYEKPESFRGLFPAGVVLPALNAQQRYQLDCGEVPAELIPAVDAVKNAAVVGAPAANKR